MADDLRQEFSIDASQALNALNQLDKGFGNLESRLNSLSKTMGQFNQAGRALDQLGTRGSQSFNNLANSGQRSARSLRGAFDEIISAHGRFTTSLQLASRIVFTQAIIKGLRLLQTSFQESVQDALKLQKAVAEIGTIAGGQLGSISQISGSVRNIAEEFNLDLLDTAAGLYQTISNQIGSAAESTEFLGKAAVFAKAGVTTLESSVNLLSGALNAYGLGVAETDRLSAEFFKTVELGRQTADNLVSDFGKVAPFASQLSVSTSELNAAFATLTVRGVSSSEAATQLKGVLSGLIKPTEAMQSALRQLGFDTAEQAIQTLGFGGLLQKLAGTTDGSAAGLAKLFSNVRGLSGALSLGTQANKQYSDTLLQIEGVSSNLAREKALEIMATDAEQLTGALNTARIEASKIGEFFVQEGAASVRFFSNARRGIEVLTGGFKILNNPETFKKLLPSGQGLSDDDAKKLFPVLSNDFENALAKQKDLLLTEQSDLLNRLSNID